MKNADSDCVESDEIILNVDVPDDTLERAGGGTDGRAITWIYCTMFGTIAGGRSSRTDLSL